MIKFSRVRMERRIEGTAFILIAALLFCTRSICQAILAASSEEVYQRYFPRIGSPLLYMSFVALCIGIILIVNSLLRFFAQT